MNLRRSRLLAFLIGLLFLSGCSTDDTMNYPSLATSVDLDRFMGVWYVHGYSPTFLDKEAHNATETYELKENGKIATTYRFQKGKEGTFKKYTPVGKIVNTETNAEWKMRFFGIISQPYLILHVDEAHTETIIGHPNRELMWIMTKSTSIEESDYERLVDLLDREGFETDRLERVPHDAAD